LLLSWRVPLQPEDEAYREIAVTQCIDLDIDFGSGQKVATRNSFIAHYQSNKNANLLMILSSKPAKLSRGLME